MLCTKEGDLEGFESTHRILAIYWSYSEQLGGGAFFNARIIEDWHWEDWILGRAICLCEYLNAHLLTDELGVMDLHTFETVRQLSYLVSRELKQGVDYVIGQFTIK